MKGKKRPEKKRKVRRPKVFTTAPLPPHPGPLPYEGRGSSSADSWSENAPEPRLFVGWLAGVALGLVLLRCVEAPVTYANVCEEADAIVQRCGTQVPLLTDAPCTGLPRLVSQCVADHATGCDDLAELARNPDRCFPDAGELPEPEPLPVPEPDLLDGGLTR